MAKELTMNNIIAKTYNKHPFVEMEKQNAPWIDSVRTAVNTYVARMEELIKMEAEFEGQPELANDDFLYERFVDNRDGDMFVANWEIFKFFVAKLEIKIAKEVIGEWLYTEHDVEMYRYFHNMKVNINNKCQPKFIKFKSGVDAKLYSVSSAELMQTAKVYYYSEEYKSHDTYFCMMELFYPLFDCVDNLVKHVKMNQTWNDVDFFDVERYVIPHQVGNAGKFDSMQDVRWQEQSQELPKEEEVTNVVGAQLTKFAEMVCHDFLDKCNKSLKYRALHAALASVAKSLYKEYAKENMGTMLLFATDKDDIEKVGELAVMYVSGVRNK